MSHLVYLPVWAKLILVSLPTFALALVVKFLAYLRDRRTPSLR
jgi:hypothetical protein